MLKLAEKVIFARHQFKVFVDSSHIITIQVCIEGINTWEWLIGYAARCPDHNRVKTQINKNIGGIITLSAYIRWIYFKHQTMKFRSNDRHILHHLSKLDKSFWLFVCLNGVQYKQVRSYIFCNHQLWDISNMFIQKNKIRLVFLADNSL